MQFIQSHQLTKQSVQTHTYTWFLFNWSTLLQLLQVRPIQSQSEVTLGSTLTDQIPFLLPTNSHKVLIHV